MGSRAPANGDYEADVLGKRPARDSAGADDAEGSGLKSVTLRLPPALLAALQELCRSTGRTASQVVADLLQGPPRSHRQAHFTARATYEPQTYLRNVAIDPSRAALLFVDIQNFNCHPDGALFCGRSDGPEHTYWWQRLAETKPSWRTLQLSCRKAGMEVMYTVMQALTADCRDLSIDYKISGFRIPPGSFDAQVIDHVRPGDDEMVIPKSSCSVFRGSNIDRVLQNMNVRHLVLAGCLTDQCVESAVRDACDSNYYVTLITDACATLSEERHEASLKAIKGFCRQMTTQQFVAELEGILFSTRQGPLPF